MILETKQVIELLEKARKVALVTAPVITSTQMMDRHIVEALALLKQEQPPSDSEQDFPEALQRLINRYSKENDSNTPDFILAEYLSTCLRAYNKAVFDRDTQRSKTGKPSDSTKYGEIKACPKCGEPRQAFMLHTCKPSDSEQGEFRKTHFDEIKANAYGMETPQFCGWLYTVIYDSYAEIDRLTAENEKLRNGICKDGCVYLEVDKKAINHHIEVRQEQQQRIQQLEKELAEAKKAPK